MTHRAPTRRWRRFVRAALAALAPPLVWLVGRLLLWTLRIEYRGADGLRGRWDRGEQAILAFWHNRQLLLPVLARRAPMCVMVSHSRDGEMATRALRWWRVATVRGSASRGGVSGFLRLLRAYRDGTNLSVLPDGPRGPRYVVKPGIVHLARALGAPIYPLAYAADRCVQLRSWDRLLIPLPFARVVVAVDEPLWVPPHADADQLEASRTALEQRLRALTEQLEAEIAPDTAAAAPRAA